MNDQQLRVRAFELALQYSTIRGFDEESMLALAEKIYQFFVKCVNVAAGSVEQDPFKVEPKPTGTYVGYPVNVTESP